MFSKSSFPLPLPHVQWALMASLFTPSIIPSLGWPLYLRFGSNASLGLRHFPLCWKRAFVRPLLMENPLSSPSDTRPIANLCEPSKIFEKVVHRQMIEFITSNNLLDCRQSGFRGGYSTQSALLRVVRQAVDFVQVLFDFTKAFDTVSHSKLLIELRGLGFSDVVLSYSYLTGRTQAVIDEGEDARVGWLPLRECLKVQFWVPSYLLLLFINDICSSLKFSEHMIFADDTRIYLSCLPSDLELKTDNDLKLNLSKSKAIILGSRAFVCRIDIFILPSISVGDTALPFVGEVGNLGVVMSSNLSWCHVLSISRRVLHRLKYHILSCHGN